MNDLRPLLLDLLAPARAPVQARLDELDPEEWEVLLAHLREHRLAPLLHWLTARRTPALNLPSGPAAALQRAFRNSGLRALRLQAGLRELSLTLDRAGIEFVALKGAFLAFHAYPHPAMRPLRDLDLLVSSKQALQAFELLLASGWTRHPDKPGDPAACLEADKHLPGLCSPDGQLMVELHSRLFDPRNHRNVALPAGFHQRCVTAPIAGTAVRFESPTDLLLHLIVHAVYDHRFDNGPLVLSDIAFLLAGQQVDWPLFWTLASDGGYLRGCLLVLKLVERDWGASGLVWPEGEDLPQEELLEQARLLMLRSFAGRSDALFGARLYRLARVLDQMRLGCAKLFRPRREIAARYPVPADSLRIFLWYPVEWSRLLLQRFPEFYRARRNPAQRSEMENLVRLERWLA